MKNERRIMKRLLYIAMTAMAVAVTTACKNVDEETLRYELEQKIIDSQAQEGLHFLETLKADWGKIVRHIKAHGTDLIRWLYENQGDMRFGAENRVFLILTDMQDPRASWKLKRNVDLLTPAISRWTSSFKRSIIGQKSSAWIFMTFVEYIV